MSTRYRIVDTDGYYYDLPDTFERSDDKGNVEIKLIERSNQPGADVSGDPRDKSKEISFHFSNNAKTDIAFRTSLNTIFYQFKKAIILQDLVSNIQTSIVFSDPSIKYEKGSNFRVSEVDIGCKQQIPYWWDLDLTTLTIVPDSNDYDYILDNEGWVETPPLFIVNLSTGNDDIPDFTIRRKSTTFGINIQDDQFTDELIAYLIDCENGTCEIWDRVLSPIDRTDKIYAGTGYFNLIVGSQTLQFVNLSGCTITLYYRKRYYL